MNRRVYARLSLALLTTLYSIFANAKALFPPPVAPTPATGPNDASQYIEPPSP